MNLKAAMNDDASRVFTNADEFGEACTFRPSGGAVGFALTLTPADAAEQFVAINTGLSDERVLQAFGSLSEITSGIATVEASRPPRRGDLVSFATGAYAGEWLVQTVAPDLGDGVMLTMRLSTRQAAADKMAEVR